MDSNLIRSAGTRATERKPLTVRGIMTSPAGLERRPLRPMFCEAIANDASARSDQLARGVDLRPHGDVRKGVPRRLNIGQPGTPKGDSAGVRVKSRTAGSILLAGYAEVEAAEPPVDEPGCAAKAPDYARSQIDACASLIERLRKRAYDFPTDITAADDTAIVLCNSRVAHMAKPFDLTTRGSKWLTA